MGVCLCVCVRMWECAHLMMCELFPLFPEANSSSMLLSFLALTPLFSSLVFFCPLSPCLSYSLPFSWELPLSFLKHLLGLFLTLPFFIAPFRYIPVFNFIWLKTYDTAAWFILSSRYVEYCFRLTSWYLLTRSWRAEVSTLCHFRLPETVLLVASELS